MARLSLSFLGSFRATLDGEPVTRFGSDKVRALLAYLAVESRGPHRRETLAGLLWPERSETNARHNLSQALLRLRRAIRDREAEPSHLIVTSQAIQFNPASDHWLDVSAFTEAVAATKSHHHHRLAACNPCVERLALAVEQYRGDFLEGLSVGDGAGYEEWCLLKRERLQRLATETLRRLAGCYEERGDREQAKHCVWRWVELEPLDEEAQRQLMRCLALSGDRTLAIARYEGCRRLLAEELGVEPSPDTVSLYERIRDGTLAIEATAPPRLAASSPPIPRFLQRASTKRPTEDQTPPVVGREPELARLKDLLEASLAGRGRVAFVTGEPGSGKTMLVREFVRRALRADGDLVAARGRCDAYTGIGDPYLPFLEILQILGGDVEAQWTSGSMTRDHVVRLWTLLPTVVQALTEVSPDLIDRFVSGAALQARAESFPRSEHPWRERLEDHLRRRRDQPAGALPHQSALFEQYTHLLQTVARERPLLLVLDDLQWADAGSTSLLFHLGRRLSGSRILVVGLYRGGEVMHSRDGHQHPLQPVVLELRGQVSDAAIELDRSEGRHFVEALLNSVPNLLDGAFRKSLYDCTGGHPLFTVELLRGLQERGDLLRDGAGRWIEGPSLDWESIPPRVEAVIRARIGSLTREQETMLTVASVEGEEFTSEVVARVLGLAEGEVTRHLSGDLRTRHGLVVAAGLQRSGAKRLSRYRFRHYLFQSYLYRSLDAVQRARLHEEVGTVLEALHGGDVRPVLAELARHFQEAGRPHKAVEYLLEAGRQATRLSADSEAVGYLRRGLALLEQLPDTPERARDELRLLLAMYGPLWRVKGSGTDPEVARASLRASELWGVVGEPEQLVPVSWGLCSYHSYRGEWETARDVGKRLLEFGEATGDSAIVLQGHYMVGNNLVFLGQPAAAREHMERVVELYDPELHRGLALGYSSTEPGVTSFMYLGDSLGALGYLDQAREKFVESLAMARELGSPFVLALILAGVAWDVCWLLEQDLAPDLIEECLALSEEYGLPEPMRLALHARALWLFRCERYDEALAQQHQVIAMDESHWDEARGPYHTLFLAEIHGKLGRTEEAVRLVESALATVANSAWAERWPYPCCVQGELLTQMRDDQSLREAEDCFRTATDIARRTQAKTLELRAAIGWARLWRVQGKIEDARELLAEIYGWFTEGFDTRYLKEARALLEELSDSSPDTAADRPLGFPKP